MKLVFFGTPDFAVPTLISLHNSSHDILSVVTAPTKRSGRGLHYNTSSIKKQALRLNIPIFEPVNLIDDNFLSKIDLLKPDIYIVVAFRILPEVLLKIPKIGAINLHASLLPKYRGSAPIAHAILNGETKTGVTTFLIENKVDNGDILLQHQHNISADTTAGELLSQLAQIGAKVVLNTIDGLVENTLNFKKQNNNLASFAPKINTLSCKINWNYSADDIHNQIRAFSPVPGAFTFYKNKRVKLFDSKVEANSKLLKPGRLNYIKPFLEIGTGSNSILIREIQIEGKKKIPVSDFILGNHNIIGDHFV